MKIQVAGPGCARCKASEKLVTEIVNELSLQAEIEHVYDVREYSRMGVRLTPAVIVDGKILIAGRVPEYEELKEAILGIAP